MADLNAGPMERAAGGAVWRRRPGGAVEVLLVHRPRYDDWSLPKGKLAPGEESPAAALREVAEETGLRCRLGQELAGASYARADGRSKHVRYWAMEPDGGTFVPNAEVDAVRWETLEDAAAVVSYDQDRAVLESLAAFLL